MKTLFSESSFSKYRLMALNILAIYFEVYKETKTSPPSIKMEMRTIKAQGNSLLIQKADRVAKAR